MSDHQESTVPGGRNFTKNWTWLQERRYAVVLQIIASRENPGGSPGIKFSHGISSWWSIKNWNETLIREFSTKHDEIQCAFSETIWQYLCLISSIKNNHQDGPAQSSLQNGPGIQIWRKRQDHRQHREKVTICSKSRALRNVYRSENHRQAKCWHFTNRSGCLQKWNTSN